MSFTAVRKAFLAKPKKMGGWIFLAGLVITILTASLNIYEPDFFRFIDFIIYDTFLRSAATAHSRQAPANPVIVDIDEKSLTRFGQWPWPRYRIGLLLDKLRKMGASSIGMDMFFPEADRTSPAALQEDIARQFRIRIDLQGIPPALRDNDKALADVLSRGPFVLGYKFFFPGDENASAECLLHPVQAVITSISATADVSAGLYRAAGATCSIRVLASSAPSSGFFNVIQDPDGVLRRAPLLIEYNHGLYPSLALATLLEASGTRRLVLTTDSHGLNGIILNGTTIPVESNGNMLIHFSTGSPGFSHISATDILLERVAPEQIRGKIVLLGTSATGIEKYQTTPVATALPGVDIHASIVDNILKRKFLSRPFWTGGLELLLLLVCGAVSAYVLGRMRAILGLFIIIAGGAGLWFAAGWLMQAGGVFISPLFPMITLGANFSLLSFMKYRQEERTVKARNRDLGVIQNFTILCLAALTETRDSETGEHILRCQHYVKILAEHLATNPKFSQILDEETIDLLYRSASLHDIGKVGISDKVLLKPSSLTIDEYSEMKKHTLYGREAIRRAERIYGENVKDSFLQLGKDMAYYHHERWDGSGYPEGLKGEEIPLFGRIMAIADVYDALICERRYKPSFSHEDAVSIIVKNKWTQFDPTVVEAFLEVEDKFIKVAQQYPDA
jgi:HD-GYP domain-containing protein (c-di-GMP phosphodiesterase class II)